MEEGGQFSFDSGGLDVSTGRDNLIVRAFETFASIEPPATRTILNRSEAPVTALLIGVQPEGGYEPMSWA